MICKWNWNRKSLGLSIVAGLPIVDMLPVLLIVVVVVVVVVVVAAAAAAAAVAVVIIWQVMVSHTTSRSSWPCVLATRP